MSCRVEDWGNDGEAADADEGDSWNSLLDLIWGEGDWFWERLSGFDLDDGIFGVGGVDGDDKRCADGALAVAGFVDDQPRGRRGISRGFFYGGGIETPSHTVTLSRCRSAKEYSEGSVFEQIVSRHGTAPLWFDTPDYAWREIRSLLLCAHKLWKSSLILRMTDEHPRKAA